MRVKLAFRHEEDDHFIVTADVYLPYNSAVPSFTSRTTYDHEDTFLQGLIAADLDDGPTQELVIAAILSVARPERVTGKIQLDITSQQAARMGLNLQQSAAPVPDVSIGSNDTVNLDYPFSAYVKPEDFHNFLMNSPTPFVMVTGPDHIFTFINAPYVRILGRTSRKQLLGRPVREAIPELVGQACLLVLDTAYKTGIPQARRELLCHFCQQDTGLIEEVYFDIVYQPTRDPLGNVSGVMAQATDVTERVLSRQVSEHREQKLYRLWAELEAIYRLAPIGLAVIDATRFTLLRLNRLQAGFMGGTVETLTGIALGEVPFIPEHVMRLLRQAAAGITVKDAQIECPRESASTPPRYWTTSIRPTLDAAGVVETLVVIWMPATSEITQDDCLTQAFLPVSQ